jgi:hypothetical protein
MGKSWMLHELARQLTADCKPGYLIGFAESLGEAPDLLLRGVVDLYVRWLSQASYRQQAKMIWNQQKPNVLPRIAQTVGKIFGALGGTR